MKRGGKKNLLFLVCNCARMTDDFNDRSEDGGIRAGFESERWKMVLGQNYDYITAACSRHKHSHCRVPPRDSFELLPRIFLLQERGVVHRRGVGERGRASAARRHRSRRRQQLPVHLLQREDPGPRDSRPLPPQPPTPVLISG